jgi:hypothetical protein
MFKKQNHRKSEVVLSSHTELDWQYREILRALPPTTVAGLYEVVNKY